MRSSIVLLATCFNFLSLAAPVKEKLSLEKRAVPVLMGSAKTFGALGALGLSSVGFTKITGTGGLGVGDGGVWPGAQTSITGFPPGTATGVLTGASTMAQNGEAACLLAYNKYVFFELLSFP